MNQSIELQPVEGDRVWSGPQMAKHSDQWTYRINAQQITELDDAIARIESRAIEIVDIDRESFPLPLFGTTLKKIRNDLQQGIGFAVIRGLPVAHYDTRQAAIAYFGIGSHLGEAVSQNAKGHALGHVYNLGIDPTLPTGRGYQSANKLNFHTDPTDVVGLMCLQKSKSGGLSSIVSSASVFNTMLEQRPDLVHELTQTLYRDRRGEIPEGCKPWYRLPVFNFCPKQAHEQSPAHLTTNYVRSTIDKAQRFSEVPRLTESQLEAFALIERTAADPELVLNMAFEPGDIQLLNNHYIMHSRTAYEDFPEAERRRHLLRLWLACEDGPPLAPAYFEFMGKTASGRPNGYLMPGVSLTAPLNAEDGGPGTTAQRLATA